MAARSASADVEEATAAALAALPPSWTVVRDPRWPEDRFPSIDHIAVGPTGVFVIDTRSWPGRVSVLRGALWHNTEPRTGVLHETAAAAASVSDLAASARFDYVHGVICLPGSNLPATWVDGVLVCSAAHLVNELTSYVEVIPGGVGKVVATDIERRLHGDGRPRRAKPAAPRPAASRPPVTKRRRPGGGLVLGVFGAALVLTLAINPSVVISVPGQVVAFLQELAEDETNPYDPEQQRPRDRDRLQRP